MPRWKELKRFCDRDGWELYKDTDHYFYRKMNDDGNIKLTKVSKGSGEIRPHMWREILNKHLYVYFLMRRPPLKITKPFLRPESCSASPDTALPSPLS